jgi:uncharacterized protein (DUF4213/DUF364 family)
MAPRTAERDLLERVYDELGDRRTDRQVTQYAVGERLVAVALGDAGMGVAHCPAGGVEAILPDQGGPLSRWAFEPPDDDPVAAALGVAALNARSVGAIPWRAGDPMAALDPDVDRIATVGLFGAAFRKFDAVDVRVIEREPIGAVDAPDGVTVSTYGPEEAAGAIADVDVLFVTGSSLIYGGTMAYLRAAVDVPTVVLIGATASFLPAPAFAAGVDVVAGTRVTDPDRVWTGIESGLCGTDLHDAGLVKVYVTAGTGSAGLDLDGDRRP